MLELVEIKIKNLASIEDQTYFFQNTLSTIIGINKDTSGLNISNEELLKLPLINLKSNGSGKTSIIEALHICLLGNCIKEKITTRQLIRNGEESMSIELICKNTQKGLSQIRIIREIYANKNKTTKVSIFETKDKEEVEIPKSTSENMDSYILNNYIGLSKDDIDNFFIIQKDKFKSFLLLSDQRKKEILSRFTGISNFGFVEDKIKEEILILKEQENEKLKIISKKEGQIDSFQQIINETFDEETFNKNKEQRINKIKSSIEELLNKNKKDKIKIEDIKEQNKQYIKVLNLWEDRLEKFNNYLLEFSYREKISEFNAQKDKINKEIDEIKEALEEATEILSQKKKSKNALDISISKLETLLENLIECPNCKFRFNPKDNSSEKDIEISISNKNLKKKKFEKEQKEIEQDILEIKELSKEKEEKIKNIDKLIQGVKDRKLRIDSIGEYIKNKINEYNKFIKKCNNSIEEIQDYILIVKNKIDNYKKQIEEVELEKYDSLIKNISKYKNNIKNLNKEINELNKDIEQINDNSQVDKDSLVNYNLFKNYLYNKIIYEIEYIVNKYLQEFSDLSVSIKGNKTLSDGKSVRDEINCLITRNNKEISYFLLSSGEKAFVDVAFILAFQKILNITSQNGFNFLILDEITGAVDSANQEELLQAINKLNKPILFITHIPTISDFKTSYIIKENNKSIILQ